jgi:hypothetical protein
LLKDILKGRVFCRDLAAGSFSLRLQLQTVDLKVEDAGSPRLYLDKVSVNYALKRYAISIASAEYCVAEARS